MQIVELSLTGVAGYPTQGRLSLGRGHVVLPAAASLLPLLRALLHFDGRPDPETTALAAAPGARAALMIRGRGGTAWRLVRDLQGGLLLQRFDEGLKRFGAVASTAAEVGSILRAQVGVPSKAIFEELFTLDAERLRGWMAAAPLPDMEPLPPMEPPPVAAVVDEAGLRRKIAALEEELEASREVDDLQRRLDAALHEIAAAERETGKVASAEKRLNELRSELPRFEAIGVAPDEVGELLEGRGKADAQRDDALRRIADDRAAHEARAEAGDPRPIWTDLRFIGAGAAGMAALGVGLFTPLRIVALLNVPAFGVAAALAVRWVGQLQVREGAARMGAVFAERERRVQAQWEAGGEKLRAALARAGVERPEELQQLIEARAAALAAVEQAEAALASVRAASGASQAAADALRAEAAALEEKLAAIGAGAYRARSSVEMELDALRSQLEGRAPEPTLGGGMPLALTGGLPPALEDALPGYRDIKLAHVAPVAPAEPDPCTRLLEHAAEMASIDRHQIGAQVAPRVASYLATLTDGRLDEVALSSATGMRCSGAAGTLAFAALPGADRALAFIALQLTLVELVSATRPFPLFYDDPLAVFDEALQRSIGGMLHALGARNQVIHRTRLHAVAEHAHAVVEAA